MKGIGECERTEAVRSMCVCVCMCVRHAQKIAKHAVSFQIKYIIQKQYSHLFGPKILRILPIFIGNCFLQWHIIMYYAGRDGILISSTAIFFKKVDLKTEKIFRFREQCILLVIIKNTIAIKHLVANIGLAVAK